MKLSGFVRKYLLKEDAKRYFPPELHLQEEDGLLVAHRSAAEKGSEWLHAAPVQQKSYEKPGS